MTVDQGRELADELGVRFLETSAKANEGVEEAFFTLARDIKVRLIDSQEASGLTGGAPAGGVNKSGNVAVGGGAGGAEQSKGGCC